MSDQARDCDAITPIWLSHHYPEQYDRCVLVGRKHICRRCMALYPLSFLVDRWHPARGEPGLPPLLTSPRAFGQATVRHAVFGVVLGGLAVPAGEAAK